MIVFSTADYRKYANANFGQSCNMLDDILHDRGFTVGAVIIMHWLSEDEYDRLDAMLGADGRFFYVSSNHVLLFEHISDAIMYKLTMS